MVVLGGAMARVGLPVSSVSSDVSDGCMGLPLRLPRLLRLLRSKG